MPVAEPIVGGAGLIQPKTRVSGLPTSLPTLPQEQLPVVLLVVDRYGRYARFGDRPHKRGKIATGKNRPSQFDGPAAVLEAASSRPCHLIMACEPEAAAVIDLAMLCDLPTTMQEVRHGMRERAAVHRLYDAARRHEMQGSVVEAREVEWDTLNLLLKGEEITDALLDRTGTVPYEPYESSPPRLVAFKARDVYRGRYFTPLRDTLKGRYISKTWWR